MPASKLALMHSLMAFAANPVRNPGVTEEKYPPGGGEWPTLLTCDIGNDWEAESSSLSGASLGASHQVSALQADGDGVPLDGCGLGVLASLHVC